MSNVYPILKIFNKDVFKIIQKLVYDYEKSKDYKMMLILNKMIEDRDFYKFLYSVMHNQYYTFSYKNYKFKTIAVQSRSSLLRGCCYRNCIIKFETDNITNVSCNFYKCKYICSCGNIIAINFVAESFSIRRADYKLAQIKIN